jgi:hypothetical protein
LLLQAGPPAHLASVLSPLRVPPAWDAPSHRPMGGRIGVRLPTFHAGAADQAHVAFMPDTIWPVSGHPPDSSRAAGVRPGFDVTCLYVTTRHQRSPRRGLRTVFPVPTWRILCAFSTSLTTTVFSQRSMWWFGASPRRAAPKGQPSSPAQHRFHELSLHRAPFHVRGTPPTVDRYLAGQGAGPGSGRGRRPALMSGGVRTTEAQAVAAGHGVDPARWQVGHDGLRAGSWAGFHGWASRSA